MSLDNPVIAVIGAGAVGGYYGARMIQHGHNVHLLTPGGRDEIRRSGMKIHSPDGGFSLAPGQINVYADPREMPRADLVLVTLKTTANDRLVELVGPVLMDHSVILTMQNGLGNEELLEEIFGEGRVIGGMAFVCINRIGPGEISHTDHGMVRLGEPRGGTSDRAKKIAEIFSGSGIRCEILDNLAFGRWDKLIWNVPFNGLGAALDLTTDKIIESKDGLKLVETLMGEVIAACRPLNLAFNLSVIEEKIRYTQTMGAYRTSMQIDRQTGRRMEIEAIIGRPLAAAQKNMVATPYMEMLYGMLKLLNIEQNQA